MSSETHKKIRSAVAEIVPCQQGFTIYSSETGFDDMEVVRVITPAWQNSDRVNRIEKIQKAVLEKLAPAERRRIFRFSVLTPKEWAERKAMFVGENRLIGRRSAHTAVNG